MVKIIWQSCDYCVFLHPDNLLIIAQFFCDRAALVVGIVVCVWENWI